MRSQEVTEATRLREFNPFDHTLASSVARVETVERTPSLPPEHVRTYSKYFSRLRTTDDFIVLADSLPGLLQSSIEARERHIAQLEEASELFVRWYCYGERTDGLHSLIRTHIARHDKYGEVGNLTAADMRANFMAMDYPQCLPIESTNRPSMVLRDMRHCSGTFGIAFITTVRPEQDFRLAPAQFLGLHRQPIDFVHYGDANTRPCLNFNPGQIDYMVEATLKFAYALLDYIGGVSRRDLDAREAATLCRLRQSYEAKALEKTAQTVYYQLRSMARYANEVEEGFFAFARGWIDAVNVTFKQP